MESNELIEKLEQKKKEAMDGGAKRIKKISFIILFAILVFSVLIPSFLHAQAFDKINDANLIFAQLGTPEVRKNALSMISAVQNMFYPLKSDVFKPVAVFRSLFSEGRHSDMAELLKSTAEDWKISLQAANFRGANFRGANLRGANLQGANLRRADFREASLREADLWGANLAAANLQGANLRAANLRAANLQGADLQGADLREANLWRANLVASNLQGANFHGANLRAANLYGADLQEADLQGTDLREADLRETKLCKASSLTDTKLDADIKAYVIKRCPELLTIKF